jgi:hypothetical protein
VVDEQAENSPRSGPPRSSRVLDTTDGSARASHLRNSSNEAGAPVRLASCPTNRIDDTLTD